MSVPYSLLGLSMISIAIGALSFIITLKSSIQKTKSATLTALIQDALTAFHARLLWSMAQILIYTTVVLYLFSLFFNRPFPLSQIISFIIGGGLMASTISINTYLTPKTVPIAISKSKTFVSDGLDYLYKIAGTIGALTFGLMSFGLCVCYIYLGSHTIIGYGLGLILTSFFLRIGGGLYKTAASICADTVSNIEKKIPHFDSRNPSTLLDITGNYISKIIGFISDIIGSFMFAIIANILLAKLIGKQSLTELPLMLLAISFIATLAGFLFSLIRIRQNKTSNFLLEGLYTTIILSGVGTWVIAPSLPIFLPYLFGLIGAIVIAFTSEYLTSYKFNPTRNVSKEAEFGSVISIFNSFSIGLLSNGIYLVYYLLMCIAAYKVSGIYGITFATIGMLSVTSMVVIINTFAPLASSTYKINKLTQTVDLSQKNCKKMHYIGQTNIALGNGFAAGAAIFTTVALLFLFTFLNPTTSIQLHNPHWLIGLMVGAVIPYVFSGILLKRLSRLIVLIVNEVKRQFSEIPFLVEDKAKPDMKQASDLNARFCVDSLTFPGILMALTPIAIGYIWGSTMLIGLTIGTLLSGLSKSFFWSNFGDSSNNARHYIENGYFGGKESQSFQHILIADNSGKAFKDLLGPSMNIVIKSVIIIAILLLITL